MKPEFAAVLEMIRLTDHHLGPDQDLLHHHHHEHNVHKPHLLPHILPTLEIKRDKKFTMSHKSWSSRQATVSLKQRPDNCNYNNTRIIEQKTCEKISAYKRGYMRGAFLSRPLTLRNRLVQIFLFWRCEDRVELFNIREGNDRGHFPWHRYVNGAITALKHEDIINSKNLAVLVLKVSLE